ncbi:MAG: undecaprenyldiphospho-muramoylpentapeptide beta-N-acetylglucosaminyltransferase [Burkholderiales bacterium]|nr:undecaprenyldiphospho-muramoylpentapeptide beta-N-acetylglucosaminyltransferase [Burkholderiales bacterium]
MQRTIMIMAGGTGGHVFPALAVAEYLSEQGWRVVWLGARTGMEAKLVPKHGYEMAWLRFSGLRGKGLLRALALPANLLLAFWQSARAILARRPDVVLGMGGYISFPGGMMAALLNRPLAIHEQNSVAGLANKVLARLADRVLQAFPGALPGAQLSGNPVRKEIAALAQPRDRWATRSGRLKLLVLGGSLGAKALNETLPRALALLPEEARPEVTHQAGAQHLEALRQGYAAAGVHAEVFAFIDDMASRYGAADVVICRAGALTVAELACAGVASILVPFPYAVDDHQTSNAKFLSARDAAILLPQTELSAARLAELLRGFTREHLLDMAEKARALGKPDATEVVARACMELAR